MAVVGLAIPLVGALTASGEGVPFAAGDMFAAVGNGTIRHFDASGRLVDTLESGTRGEGGGMAFDPAGNLYAVGFGSDTVSRFDSSGYLVGPFGDGYDSHPESIVRDRAGNFYVGLNDGTRQLRKLDPAGNLVRTYSPAVENRGVDWTDLAPDQCTLFYTSEGRLVKRFDVCADRQLSDFAALPITGDNRTSPTSAAYAVRIRPNGEIVVASAAQAFRLGPGGNLIQSYSLPGATQLLTINLDRDLTSFWVGDQATGRVFKVDAGSGEVTSTLDADATLGLTGFAVLDEPVASEPVLSLTGPSAQALGQPASLTARILNVGQPAGVPVTFTVTGPNAQAGTVATDGSGAAVFPFVGASPGVDTVVATAAVGAPPATVTSRPLTVARTEAAATALVYSGASTGAQREPAVLAARLTEVVTNQPVAGVPVDLGISGGERCQGLTDPGGVATCTVRPAGPPGPKVTTAGFAGTPGHAPSSASSAFVLTPGTEPQRRAPTALVFTGPASGLRGELVVLRARLIDSRTGQPVSGAPVSFAVDGTDRCGAATDADGVATCSVRPQQPVGSYPVAVTNAGGPGHQPSSTTAQLRVVAPAGPVMGGRAVVVATGGPLVGDILVSDTGDVATDVSSTTTRTAVALPGPLITGATPDAGVTTNAGVAQARAAVVDLAVGLPGPPLPLGITVRAVSSEARSACADGSSGRSAIGYLAIGPVVLVDHEVAFAPNTRLVGPELGSLLGISVVLNEQVVRSGRDGSSITVNAVHIVVAGILDLVIASSRTDVHNCQAA